MILKIDDIPDNATVHIHCKVKRHNDMLPGYVDFDGQRYDIAVPRALMEYLPHVGYDTPFTGKEYKDAWLEWVAKRE